jgi:hypothetical protein
MPASTTLTRPSPFTKLPQEIKTLILQDLDGVDLICFALSTKEHYHWILAVRQTQDLKSLVPSFRVFSTDYSIYLQPDGPTAPEQFVTRLWTWLGGRCAYCGYTQLELSKFENNDWAYCGHPCKAGIPQYGGELDHYFGVYFHEVIIGFDIDNWISRRQISSQAFQVLIQLFSNYHCIGILEYGLMIDDPIRADYEYDEFLARPVLPNVPSTDFRWDTELLDKIKLRWGQWSSIRKETALLCFDSPEHRGFLDIGELYLTYVKLPPGVGLLADQRCICQCVAKLGRPYSLETPCSHTQRQETVPETAARTG